MSTDDEQQREARMAALQRFIDAIDAGTEAALARFEGRVPRSDIDLAIDLGRELGRAMAGTRLAVASPQQDSTETMRSFIASAERRLERLQAARERVRASRAKIAASRRAVAEGIRNRHRIQEAEAKAARDEERAKELDGYAARLREEIGAETKRRTQVEADIADIEARTADAKRRRKAAQERLRLARERLG